MRQGAGQGGGAGVTGQEPWGPGAQARKNERGLGDAHL